MSIKIRGAQWGGNYRGFDLYFFIRTARVIGYCERTATQYDVAAENQDFDAAFLALTSAIDSDLD